MRESGVEGVRVRGVTDCLVEYLNPKQFGGKLENLMNQTLENLKPFGLSPHTVLRYPSGVPD